ncbi:hypothetical protein VTN96DRAFT_6842 [Rasamsonia emersonii]|uniref:Uncharacterized protein n=1 Tax=Rasamsonia emersonii (strain ATCC 16479 / CBS 393.64 / IMI 116815) TaxID=1408163 RepID=A0A0F4YMR3_RASE3|nr:hypothetical protein T310_6486 [Rasamsonia emersonii CBS 393.64]KKA19529.1 hypothetical protein T310_6486 [Rasamsonia emersonii CBS 393.64]
MANQVSLMTYLQQALPAIPTNQPPNPGHNTTNTLYGAADINNIGRWNNFNLTTVLQRYQNVLFQAHLPSDPMPISPPRAITAENALRSKLSEYLLPRVRRGLRAGFGYLAANGQMSGITALSFDVGEYAEIIDGFKPDTAYFVVSLPEGSGPNRAPGDIKPSWKWNTAMATHPVAGVRNEYRQALSQVNWYMKQHRSRYGFLGTDREFVVFRRLDDDGNLELAEPIPFTAGGTDAQPQMTVSLALWYLGMLAAKDQGDECWFI